MAFMLATVELEDGKLGEFNEIVPHIVEGVEAHGWRLVGAWTTVVGPLHEVFDLWEVADANANAIGAGLEAARQDPEFARWAARMSEVAEHEELRLLAEMPSAVDRSR